MRIEVDLEQIILIQRALDRFYENWGRFGTNHFNTTCTHVLQHISQWNFQTTCFS